MEPTTIVPRTTGERNGSPQTRPHRYGLTMAGLAALAESESCSSAPDFDLLDVLLGDGPAPAPEDAALLAAFYPDAPIDYSPGEACLSVGPHTIAFENGREAVRGAVAALAVRRLLAAKGGAQ